jgi:hypothetical protein
MLNLLYKVILTPLLLIILFGIPSSVDAANFQMKTGYYVGSGVNGLTISNIGFQPNLVMIKSNTDAGVMVFKTSAMPANTTAFMSATAHNTATQITLTETGFIVGTISEVNSVNVRYSYIAFAGSDCTSTGTFCVGRYTGNGSNPRDISTGFQPSLAIVKRSTNVAAHFRTASMPVNTTNYFTTTSQNTTGALIADFTSTAFIVGNTDNANGGIYDYIAFPTTEGIMTEGTYIGNNTNSRNIVTGFRPNMVVVNNSTSGNSKNLRSVMNITQDYGDNSSYIGDAVANGTNLIKDLQSDGFQIGSDGQVNQNNQTFYWFAFGGALPTSGASGTFTMHTGTYTGTGVNQSITGIGFQPDLVIIKDDSNQVAVFRTRMMRGDITAHMSSASTDFALGITLLTADGFDIGTSTIVNTLGNTYQYQAFGNAYNPYTNTGAADFAIGLYYGNGVDNRDIDSLPFNPNFVAIKRNSTTAGVFRVSANTGDQTNFFSATAQGINIIQSFGNNTFQIGTDAAVNTSGSNYRWFAFAEGANFDVGTYTGNGVDNRDIISPAFDLALVWIKRSTAIAAVMRPKTLIGDLTQYFTATANVAGRIKNFITNGFRLGTETEVNQNNGIYYFAAWRDRSNNPLSVNIVDSGGNTITSPVVNFPSIDTKIDCQTNTSVLGVSNAKIRVTNGTNNPQWNLTIAATGGINSSWSNSTGGSYDFNDPSGSGCSDGPDTDSISGVLSIDPSVGTITPSSGCNNIGLVKGSNSSFSQGIVDSITLLTAGHSSDTSGCYWDITGIDMSQTIPREQINGVYNINFTISVLAF